CLMPYVLDDYTKYIYPLKMHEYLASGQPVVSTPIRSVLALRDVVLVAGSRSEWEKAIMQALGAAENSSRVRMRRQRVAQAHDWDVLVRKIAEVITERLGLPACQRWHEIAPVGPPPAALA